MSRWKDDVVPGSGGEAMEMSGMGVLFELLGSVGGLSPQLPSGNGTLHWEEAGRCNPGARTE